MSVGTYWHCKVLKVYIVGINSSSLGNPKNNFYLCRPKTNKYDAVNSGRVF